MEGTTLTTLVQMVSSGIGVTLIPQISVPFETKSAKVSVSRFQQQKPKRTIGLVWRKSNPLTRQFIEIAELLKNLNKIGEEERPIHCIKEANTKKIYVRV